MLQQPQYIDNTWAGLFVQVAAFDSYELTGV
jgi:hypothetical protein